MWVKWVIIWEWRPTRNMNGKWRKLISNIRYYRRNAALNEFREEHARVSALRWNLRFPYIQWLTENPDFQLNANTLDMKQWQYEAIVRNIRMMHFMGNQKRTSSIQYSALMEGYSDATKLVSQVIIVISEGEEIYTIQTVLQSLPTFAGRDLVGASIVIIIDQASRIDA